MNKPLRDWTLGELQEYCAGRHCEKCKWDVTCKCAWVNTSPCDWDLSDPPCWTEQDIEDARAIKRVFKWVTEVSRGMNDVYITGEGLTRRVDAALFPGLEKGEIVILDEILGGADDATD